VFTNHGPWVPVFAPGEKIVSTFPANGYAAWSGTSMAAPFVAGQAALLRGLDSRLTVEQMSARIVTTAKPLVGGPTGAAVIDIPASLNASDLEEDDNDGDADD
jgi:subtilisin family serine protease